MVGSRPGDTIRTTSMDDLLIRGGHVIDGTGGPGRDADVAVHAGRVVAVEPRSARPAHRVTEARGQVVAPDDVTAPMLDRHLVS